MSSSLLSKSTMEMPEQEVPAVYSQMLQMFPNVPQEIIWMYVRQYSSDVKKCAQMLNLQNIKYTAHNYSVESGENLNDFNIAQPFPLILLPKTVNDNNNDKILNNECDEQTEQTSYDSHSSYSTSLVSPSITEKNDFFVNPCVAINFNEPLMLDIVPDDAGISHSWRPSNSDDMLCPNIFVPSPVTENFQPSNCQIPNRNVQQKHLEFHLNPKTADKESGTYSMTAQVLYNYPLPNWRDSGKDISSYLHYQKSQMNALRYEVINAKIELSDARESVESLEKELKEKMQSKSVQDIIDLNKEIEKLRLDCQHLCSEIDEIDDSIEDPILLGDVDQRINVKKKSPGQNADAHTTVNSTNSNVLTSINIQDESNKWQCSNCTFANHPAIDVCEMCQLPKSVTRRPSFLRTPSSSCYCHPKENTLPIQS